MGHPESGFPLLWTERLKLRELAMSDCDDLHEILCLPQVTRFSNWPDAPKLAQTERSLKWMRSAYLKAKGCAWAIEDRNSGRFLGSIRFNGIDRKWKSAEVGYEMHPSAWGKGLMTEALKAVTACGFAEFSLNRIEAWTLPGNGASDKVLEKVGFRYEGTLYQKAWFKNAFHDFRMFGCLANGSLPSQKSL